MSTAPQSRSPRAGWLLGPSAVPRQSGLRVVWRRHSRCRGPSLKAGSTCRTTTGVTAGSGRPVCVCDPQAHVLPTSWLGRDGVGWQEGLPAERSHWWGVGGGSCRETTWPAKAGSHRAFWGRGQAGAADPHRALSARHPGFPWQVAWGGGAH